MSYKRLGDYIIEKVEFNDGNKYKLLQGVSNNKYFQKAKTNIIGIDLAKYRVAHYNQFVFNRATTRNGDKISIALRKGESCIVSPSYRIFEVRDENVLHPDYLQMWFTRPEFDRYARFKSHGSAHEFFDMEEMCEVELPIPSIEEQRQIVAQYQSIANKIKVNEQICEKLEATAQALYKHWFVDFEFPNEEGKPYKSSGGQMVWNEELGKEIPEEWEVTEFQTITNVTSGKSVKNPNGSKYPIYGAGGITGYTNDFLFDENIIIIGRVGTHGKVFIEYGKSYPSDNTLVFTPNYLYFSYFLLKFLNYDELNKGGVQALLTQSDLKQLHVLIPKFDLPIFEEKMSSLFELKNNIEIENQKLTQLQSLLLSRLAVGEEEKRKIMV
ncbi:restriction endonuclease subunit S [Chryseobacterium sp. NEB161]|nr:restriction endonuclease subunit S [Chryseobacterium sp. NEB161]